MLILYSLNYETEFFKVCYYFHYTKSINWLGGNINTNTKVILKYYRKGFRGSIFGNVKFKM